MFQQTEGLINEILKSVWYLIKKAMRKTTRVYDGIIISNNNDGRWNVRYNGNLHAVKPYGSITPTVGAMVKVIVPQGNQALAFFI